MENGNRIQENTGAIPPSPKPADMGRGDLLEKNMKVLKFEAVVERQKRNLQEHKQ